MSGSTVPRSGPVLLVANHPNSLLDPFLVVVGARRPVRFLAKSPLFSDPLVGWGVRAVGAIPVYRRMDDPQQVGRNEETFRAVYAALEEQSAVGIFPEGISHDHPALVPLKTGAARIALAALPLVGGAFPIVPVGLVFESKEEFRSRAYIVVGDPVDWADLANVELVQTIAVRELTQRIQSALHEVTVNLQRREDAELIAAATAIYDAEIEEAATPHEEAARRIAAARALARLHLAGDVEAADAAQFVRQHARTLAVLGLTPEDVHRPLDFGTAVRWTVRRLSPAELLMGLAATAGAVIFWPPYRLTRALAERKSGSADVLATRKLLYGAALFKIWILALAALVGLTLGWPYAVAALVLLPALALKTLSYGERWTEAARTVRSFFVLRSRTHALEVLRADQRAIGERLRALYLRAASGPGEQRAS